MLTTVSIFHNYVLSTWSNFSIFWMLLSSWLFAACTVDFQTQNYTIITSQCKGPLYPQEACCDSFTEFACPFADELNDNSTNCAETMFSYINVYGNYPAGLFANMCVSNSSLGLPCPDNNSTSAVPPSSNAPSDFFGTYSRHHRVLLWVALASSTVLVFDMSVFFSNR